MLAAQSEASRPVQIKRHAASVLRGERGAVMWILALLVTYLSLQVLFLASTTAAASIPNSLVVDRLATSADQRLWDATDYPLDGVGHPTASFPFAGISDAFTECIALTMGVEAQNRGSALHEAIAGPHLGTCSLAVPSVESLAGGGSPTQSFEYNRYWNGFTVITRPALAVGGVGAVRLAVGLIFASGIVAAATALQRRLGIGGAIALLLPVLASTNILTQPAHGFSHALSFGVAAWGVAVGVWVALKPLPMVLIVGACVGAVFNFVDFLLNPPLAWAFFAFAVAATRWRRRPDRLLAVAAAAGVAAAGWLGGYAVTWMTKWAIAVAVFGQSAWAEILGVITNRIQGQYDGLVVPGIGQPTVRNFLFWYQTIPTARVIFWCGVVIVLIGAVAVLVRQRVAAIAGALVLASPILLIVGWLELLSNHSQIHVFFVYRSVPAAIGIVVAAIVVVAAHRAPALSRARTPVTVKA